MAMDMPLSKIRAFFASKAWADHIKFEQAKIDIMITQIKATAAVSKTVASAFRR